MIFCARASRGLRRVGRAAWPSFCSRNAHDKNVLVRRAQSRNDQATLEHVMAELNGRAQWGTHPAHPLETVNERAWKNYLWSLAAALPAERCVLARRGWAGEKAGLSEHPAMASA
jgi:hypothetical protein